MNIRDIFVSVPTRGSVKTEVVKTLSFLEQNYGIRNAFYSTGHLTATDARNKIRKEFLSSGCKVLLMCDDDVCPANTCIDMALREKQGIVAAPVMIVHSDVNIPFWNVYDAVGDGWTPDPNQFAKINTGLEEKDAVGFGCVAISRDIVENMPPFWLEYDEWGMATRSEDLVYCKIAKQKGYKVYVDWNARAEHLPSINIQQTMEKMHGAVASYVEARIADERNRLLLSALRR